MIAAGLLLVALAWALNWSLPGLRTHLLFFPLWLGYCLVIDGWTRARTGSSPFTRAGWRAVGLFLCSIPVWWLFELLNGRLGNWEYVGRERFGDLAYFLLASLAFSTVVPAVLGTAELVRSAAWIERRGPGPSIRVTPRGLPGLLVLGLVMLVAMLAWPRVLFPLCWISLVLVLAPVCRWSGRPSLLEPLERGDWRPLLSLGLAGLICGFFWELWNVRSFPKWIYHIPFVGRPKLFEMPLLGYLGYVPFALELYLFAQLFAPRRARPRLALREDEAA